MKTVRIALANVRFPVTPDESVELALAGIEDAASHGAEVICFPECFVPGYRLPDTELPPPDRKFLEHAWSVIADAAGMRSVSVILGTERIVSDQLLITALVVNRDGSLAGFQDKNQLDPSEESTYAAGAGRHIFRSGPLTFGITICHEGWRYPETVRWAARRGAQLVFHPHFHPAEPGTYRPRVFGDPNNSFHEKAALCRAAENTCYFATVNFASSGSPTTSAVIDPEGDLVTYQPYGQEGLLIADVDISKATRVLANRYKPIACD